MEFLSYPAEVIAAAALCVAIASAARRLSGFGFALIGAPLLSLFFPPQQMVAIVLWLQVFLGVSSVLEFRSELDWPVLRQLAIGGALTAPLGVLLLMFADPNIVLFIMGICVITAASILGFFPSLIKVRATPRSNVASGMVAGLMSSSVGMPGPPLAIYFMGQTDMPANTRRAMLITTFSLLACVSLGVAFLGGQVRLTSFWMALVLLVPAVLGSYVGERLHRYLDRKLVERFALLLVFLSGFLCLVRAF